MTAHRSIRTPKAPAALGPYSQAVEDEGSGLIFCSGQIGLDPATNELAPGGAEAEARQCLRNVQAMLISAGCDLEDIVRTVLFLTDLKDFAAVNMVYADTFREPFPARSTVQVAALPKGARVEIEATASRRTGGARP